MGIMGTLVHYSRIMARSNNAAIRALSIILYSQRNNDIHYPERIMDDKKQCIIHDSLSIIHAKRLSRTLTHRTTLLVRTLTHRTTLLVQTHNANRSLAPMPTTPLSLTCTIANPVHDVRLSSDVSGIITSALMSSMPSMPFRIFFVVTPTALKRATIASTRTRNFV